MRDLINNSVSVSSPPTIANCGLQMNFRQYCQSNVKVVVVVVPFN